MLTKHQKKDFSSLKVDIMNLNMITYFLIKKINRLAYLWKTTTREYILEEFVALRYIENGVILHLTNLDDDTNSKFSFRQAAKVINKSIKDRHLLDQLSSLLKSYRKNINGLKTKHRNIRIAHLNYDKDIRFDEFLEFETVLKPLIDQANLIAEFIWGEEIKAQFKLGSIEGVLDFRNDPTNLQIDIKKIEGFY